MPLNDYWDKEPGQGGGQYLTAGDYDVRVTNYRIFKTPNDTPGVEFTVTDRDGRTAKTQAFWLTDAALPHLAAFAKACGLTREQAAAYEPTNDQSHRMLLNKPLQVTVVPDERNPKYHIVGSYRPRKGGSSVPTAPPLQAPIEPVPFTPQPTLAPDEDVF